MRLIDARALQECIHKSKLSNPHSDPKIARNHEYEHDHFMQMVVQQPTIEEHPIVWVVSWYNSGEEPVVTVFNNEENAMKYYNYELANNHVEVAIDGCPVYSTFSLSTERSV